MFGQMDAYGIVDLSRPALGQDLWDRSAMNRGRLVGRQWQRNWHRTTATNTTPPGTINNRRFAAAIAAESLAPLLFCRWNVRCTSLPSYNVLFVSKFIKSRVPATHDIVLRHRLSIFVEMSPNNLTDTSN